MQTAESASTTKSFGRYTLALILFLITFVTTTLAQLPITGSSTEWQSYIQALGDLERLKFALSFSLPLMFIMTVHELGHFFVARAQKLPLSPPLFLPAPTMFGTLGSVMLMHEQPTSRPFLLRLAAAGPLAGLLCAIGFTAWGLMHSQPLRALPPTDEISLRLGSSLIFEFLRMLAGFSGNDLILHPTAFAGWVGLFLTALNLVPAGQLDGGHILYALIGRKQRLVSSVSLVVLTLISLSLAFQTYAAEQGLGSLVWLFWAFLILLMGSHQPPDDLLQTPPRLPQKLLGYLMLVFFLLTFVPTPLQTPGGKRDNRRVNAQRGALLLPYFGPSNTSRGRPPTTPEEFRL